MNTSPTAFVRSWTSCRFTNIENAFDVMGGGIKLKPIVEFAQMPRRHWEGILHSFTSKLDNGLLEGLNSLVQAAKARARGYRSAENFELMI